MHSCCVREIVEWAITTRRSVRCFTDEPVPRATIERILEIASRAPSGSNIQPWKVHVLIGAALERSFRRRARSPRVRVLPNDLALALP